MNIRFDSSRTYGHRRFGVWLFPALLVERDREYYNILFMWLLWMFQVTIKAEQ